jgi:hypothetical protein
MVARKWIGSLEMVIGCSGTTSTKELTMLSAARPAISPQNRVWEVLAARYVCEHGASLVSPVSAQVFRGHALHPRDSQARLQAQQYADERQNLRSIVRMKGKARLLLTYQTEWC